MNGYLAAKNSSFCVANLRYSWLLRAIRALPTWMLGKGREHDCKDAGGSATQEAKAEERI